ncbi:cytochrome c [Ochrobactrum sp. SFR4]|uniref:c-type cytochrome n=1 Tax=Ochrobactrum sp. SFR4 TaxID=2717368 RepID=UPI000EFC00BB|nr:cytochrome c [Ochrobactrum sp. SFR4]MBX8824528.1 cytochrome c [Ochrobactrum sp. SFR4]
MQKSLAIFSALFMMTTAASASPVTDRQALMKDVGRSMGVLGPIMKGDKPFEAEAVQAALEQLKADAIKMDAEKLFPKGSESGDTAAAPKIWEDEAGFKVEIEKFRTATAAAADAKPQDVDALRVSMKDVGASCGTCHQAYRIKK